MADSIQEIIMDDEKLEDFAEIMQGREPDLIGPLQQLQKGQKQNEVDADFIDQLFVRVAKLESQIGRILIHLGITKKDEIVITNEMPE